MTTTPTSNKPEVELCRRCLCWDRIERIGWHAAIRAHTDLEFCVARIADRLGEETIDQAMTRLTEEKHDE